MKLDLFFVIAFAAVVLIAYVWIERRVNQIDCPNCGCKISADAYDEYCPQCGGMMRPARPGQRRD